MIDNADNENELEILLFEDDDGEEHEVAIIDKIEHNGHIYIAVSDYSSEEDEISEDGDVLILKMTEEDGEVFYTEMEDDEEFASVSSIFEERSSDEDSDDDLEILSFDDDDGNEYEVAVIDQIENQGTTYIAVRDYSSEIGDFTENSGFDILKISNEDGEKYYSEIEDEKEFKLIASIFEYRLNNEDEEYKADLLATWCENYEEMKEMFLRSAEKGEVISMKLLADLLYRGPDGKADDRESAFPWWKKAADGGDADAQMIVGGIYKEGDTFIAADHRQAFHYFEKSALQGIGFAQYQLGGMYFAENNLILGIHWICCAHLNHVTEATDFLEKWIPASEDPQAANTVVTYALNQIKAHGCDPKNCDYTQANERSNSDTQTGAGKEGCYIATAVYGSYDAPEVLRLRRFRDEVLKQSGVGRTFIKCYYAISPPLAEKLKYAKNTNRIVKAILDRIVCRLNQK